MTTICIGRETIEALSGGEPVDIGQGCFAIPTDSYDRPYGRISDLETALRETVDASRRQLALIGRGIEPSERLAAAWAAAEKLTSVIHK